MNRAAAVNIGIFKLGLEIRHDSLMSKIRVWVRMDGSRVRAMRRRIRAMKVFKSNKKPVVRKNRITETK